MDIYTRVENLEKLVDSLVTTMNNNKFYTDADISGVRKNVSDITPYEDTKTAYIDDIEVVFFGVPNGNYNVTFDKPIAATKVTKESFTDGTSTVTVNFEPLEEVTKVKLTII